MNIDEELNDAITLDLKELIRGHDYYLDTVSQFRSTCHCYFDMILIVLIIGFCMMGLENLMAKNIISNIHQPWVEPDLIDPVYIGT